MYLIQNFVLHIVLMSCHCVIGVHFYTEIDSGVISSFLSMPGVLAAMM